MPKMDHFSYILRINTACQLIFASPRANRARLLQIFIFGLLLREKKGGEGRVRRDVYMAKQSYHVFKL